MQPNFEWDGRIAVLYDGIVRRGMCAFKSIRMLRLENYHL